MADATRNCCSTSTLDEFRCPPAGGHTPGPWHAEACNSWNVWSKDCKVADPIRCAQAEPYRVPSDEERIANAKLIAASPTLLEAAMGALELIESGRIYEQQCCGGGSDCGCRGSTYADEATYYLRDAITLATGKDA